MGISNIINYALSPSYRNEKRSKDSEKRNQQNYDKEKDKFYKKFDKKFKDLKKQNEYNARLEDTFERYYLKKFGSQDKNTQLQLNNQKKIIEKNKRNALRLKNIKQFHKEAISQNPTGKELVNSIEHHNESFSDIYARVSEIENYLINFEQPQPVSVQNVNVSRPSRISKQTRETEESEPINIWGLLAVAGLGFLANFLSKHHEILRNFLIFLKTQGLKTLEKLKDFLLKPLRWLKSKLPKSIQEFLDSPKQYLKNWFKTEKELLFNKINSVKNYALEKFSSLKAFTNEKFKNAKNFTLERVKNLNQHISEKFNKFVSPLKDEIKNLKKSFFERFPKLAKAKDTLKSSIKSAKTKFNKVKDFSKKGLSKLWGYTKKGFQIVKDTTVKVGKFAFKKVTDGFKKIVEKVIKPIFFNAIKKFGETALKWCKRLFKSVIFLSILMSIYETVSYLLKGDYFKAFISILELIIPLALSMVGGPIGFVAGTAIGIALGVLKDAIPDKKDRKGPVTAYLLEILANIFDGTTDSKRFNEIANSLKSMFGVDEKESFKFVENLRKKSDDLMYKDIGSSQNNQTLGSGFSSSQVRNQSSSFKVSGNNTNSDIAKLIQETGDFSLVAAKSESNMNPGAISRNPNDPGGASYGMYQFASKTGTLADYIKNSKYKTELSSTTLASAEFDAIWQKIATLDPEGFAKDQRDYILKSHFNPVVEQVSIKSGIDLNSRSNAVKSLILSTGVQYGAGGATTEILNAFKKFNISNNSSDEEILRAIQQFKMDNRFNRFKSWYANGGNDSGIVNRINNDLGMSLSILNTQNSTSLASSENLPTIPEIKPTNSSTVTEGLGSLETEPNVSSSNNALSLAIRASQIATQRANSSSTGYCAKYTRQALQYAGFSFTPNGNAADYLTNGILTSIGFKPTQMGSDFLTAKYQPGDVMVYPKDYLAGTSKPYGHMQIFNGKNWVSDFIQRSPSVNSKYNSPKFFAKYPTLFRAGNTPVQTNSETPQNQYERNTESYEGSQNTDFENNGIFGGLQVNNLIDELSNIMYSFFGFGNLGNLQNLVSTPIVNNVNKDENIKENLNLIDGFVNI